MITNSPSKGQLKGTKSDEFFNTTFINDLYRIVCIIAMKLDNPKIDYREVNLKDDSIFVKGLKNITDNYIRKTNKTLRWQVSRYMLYHFCIKEMKKNHRGSIIHSHTLIYEYVLAVIKLAMELDLIDVIHTSAAISDKSMEWLIGTQKVFIDSYCTRTMNLSRIGSARILKCNIEKVNDVYGV